VTFTTPSISDILICGAGCNDIHRGNSGSRRKTCPCSITNPRAIAGFLVNENLPETQCDI